MTKVQSSITEHNLEMPASLEERRGGGPGGEVATAAERPPQSANLLVHRPQTDSDATRMQKKALPRPVRVAI